MIAGTKPKRIITDGLKQYCYAIKFKCEKCKLEISADYNAARNIASPEINKIIAKATKGVVLGEEKMRMLPD